MIWIFTLRRDMDDIKAKLTELESCVHDAKVSDARRDGQLETILATLNTTNTYISQIAGNAQQVNQGQEGGTALTNEEKMSKNFTSNVSGGSPQINQGQEGGEATNVTNNYGSEEPTAFDAMREAIKEAEAVAAKAVEAGESPPPVVFPEIPEEIYAEAEANAMELVESTPEQDAEVEAMTPLGFVDALETESAKPEEEQNKGFLSAMVRGAKKMAPYALAGGEALLMATVKTHPAVGAALAVIKLVKSNSN